MVVPPQALEAGADEALMLDPTGAVATCNATNFFVVRRGEVWTSTGHYSLNGITRRMIINLCLASGVPVFEQPFSLTDVYGADEAFVTGTFGGITPVVEVTDAGSVPAGAVTNRPPDGSVRGGGRRGHRRVAVSGCLRLSVWSGPRNVSTALMYSFRQRADTMVVDEPLYGHYLKTTGADHPGAREVLEVMDGDGECGRSSSARASAGSTSSRTWRTIFPT